jgi:hypothetical protein
MIQEGLRVTIPLKDKTLCVVAVEVQLVLQSPGVFSAHRFHASRAYMSPLDYPRALVAIFLTLSRASSSVCVGSPASKDRIPLSIAAKTSGLSSSGAPLNSLVSYDRILLPVIFARPRG